MRILQFKKARNNTIFLGKNMKYSLQLLLLKVILTKKKFAFRIFPLFSVAQRKEKRENGGKKFHLIFSRTLDHLAHRVMAKLGFREGRGFAGARSGPKHRQCCGKGGRAAAALWPASPSVLAAGREVVRSRKVPEPCSSAPSAAFCAFSLPI